MRRPSKKLLVSLICSRRSLRISARDDVRAMASQTFCELSLSINGRAQFSGMGTSYRSSFQPKRKDINTTPMLVMHMRTTSAQTHHRLLEALVVSVGDADPTWGFEAAQ